MIFASPSPTQADLHFRIAGIPVRIHPFFWVVALLLTIGATKEPVGVLIGIGSILVSIVVHEMGHALVQRRFGGRPASAGWPTATARTNRRAARS